MNRTQYFQNTQSAKSIKRITANGLVEYYFAIDKRWALSTYRIEELKNKDQFRQITRDKARKLRPAAFRSQPKPKKTPPVGLEFANKLRAVVNGIDYTGAGKIRAIKALRSASTRDDWELVLIPGGNRSNSDFVCGSNQCLGLAESKMIVENFEKFIEFVEIHNELPLVSWDSRNPFTKRFRQMEQKA